MTLRTARARPIRHHRCRWWSRVSPETRCSMKGVHDMVLKGFSYAMIGAFLGGLAMTVTGSAGVLMGF
ncbi:hypothetical protein MRA01_61060 [Methylobacterium radiotolerans]|nr:hypothetical protein MRA01_61060 [Methylobacterium radiotolerans]